MALVLWPGQIVPVVQAQEPTFKIAIHPHADFSLTGHPFTYTVVITNSGPTAPSNIIVRVALPAGATFRQTTFSDDNWLARSKEPGSSGDVVWLSQPPVAVGQTNQFQLVVNVTAPGGELLVIDDYQVIVLDSAGGTPLATGPAIRTPILTQPPTPTPSPIPTIATNTPSPPTPTPTAIPAPPPTVPPTPNSTELQPFRLSFLLTGLVLVAGIIIAMLALIIRLIRPR